MVEVSFIGLGMHAYVLTKHLEAVRTSAGGEYLSGTAAVLQEVLT
jgi:hypothetical protein